jgi:hypothetical protein
LKITFTNMSSFPDLEKPQLASKVIPEWYKEIGSYVGDKKIPQDNGTSPGTIKKCVPVFDAITAGYIIVSPADVYVSLKDGNQFFHWSAFDLIAFHTIEQAPNHPTKNPFPYAKWINLWSIKTPKGYSTLFVQPFHRESVFTILPGIVDTDTYSGPVNFPMVINDPTFEGLIPKGTPIAQVIPIKRESWKMEFGNQKDAEQQINNQNKLSTVFFNRYKTMFWNKKEYK